MNETEQLRPRVAELENENWALRDVLDAARADLPTYGTEWVRQGDHEFELVRVNPATHERLRLAVFAAPRHEVRNERPEPLRDG